MTNKTFEDEAKKFKKKIDKSRIKYFIPKKRLPDATKALFKNKFVEFDQEAEEVEDVLGDITALQPMDSANADLNAARLDNLKVRTEVLKQKLSEQKQAMWSEWNEAFFTVFSEAFAKFKNELISLHLNEEQLATLNEKLDNALTIMR